MVNKLQKRNKINLDNNLPIFSLRDNVDMMIRQLKYSRYFKEIKYFLLFITKE